MTNFLTPITVLAPTTGSNPVTKTYLDLAYRLSGSKTVLTSGTTYNIPSEARAIRVRGCGGGGGGGGIDGQGSGTAAASTAGSGSGWFDIFIENPLSSYAYTIGAGGSGGAAGSNAGTNGGSTTFSGGGNTATANGGIAGAGNTGSAITGTNAGKVGGEGSLVGFSGVVGKGGSSVGWGKASGVLVGLSVSGGSLFGGGIISVEDATGTSATFYGEGGGACHSSDVAANRAGGSGGQGVIEIWIYL